MQGWLIVTLMGVAVQAQAADYVIAVSIDGMGSAHMQKLVGAGKLPNLKRLEVESVWTANARNDHDITVTLPNHVTMVTSRPILGAEGHHWRSNTDPERGTTLHSRKGAYVAGVFDVVHDSGRRTGVWATKTKFSLLDSSWDTEDGAPDVTGPDNGRDKVDEYVYCHSSDELTSAFLSTMGRAPVHFAFVHFGEGDAAGHEAGWGSPEYDEALAGLDACLGRIMAFAATNAALSNKTALIVTADHGGAAHSHHQADDALNYTVPFFVWGAGPAGDLYAMNPSTRRDPGLARPDHAQRPPPIRNGEVGNLALQLLGLPPIPGATLNARQDLSVKKTE